MSYIPTTWKAGDVVTSEKLNKMEQGISGAAGSGGTMFVTLNTDTGALDKTWSELATAVQNGIVPFMSVDMGPAMSLTPLQVIGVDQGNYGVYFDNVVFFTDSQNGYPVQQGSDNGGNDTGDVTTK